MNHPVMMEVTPPDPDEFTFVVLGDRTGGARPGVFERAVTVANRLRPHFALMVGDMIEGYTEDPAELGRQWDEFEAMASRLRAPLLRTPGNHDVSNPVMRDDYRRRFGATFSWFRYRDVLFLVLDTQDPPPEAPPRRATDENLDELKRSDPAAFAARIGSRVNWASTMPAEISDEQTAWAEEVLAENADVRWTFVVMHMPAWQGDGHPALDRIRRALGGRKYTMLAGHAHNYRHTVIDGMDHIRVGPCGGVFVDNTDDGNFDHVTLVAVTAGGPEFVNIVLDGVIGVEGGAFEPRRWDEAW
jgi:3',5'-cyclic AMP phosphodiesterase CpdA